MSVASLVAAQENFTASLPAVENQLQAAFRRLRPQDREDAVAEARAAAWSAWAGLIRKVKDPVAVGVLGFAHNAIRYVKNGRTLGDRNAGRVPFSSDEMGLIWSARSLTASAKRTSGLSRR
jgi:hypothetical protein